MADCRLFVGTPLAGNAQDVLSGFHAALCAEENLFGLPIRWVPPENWHLTWAFLGSVPRQSVAGITALLDNHMAINKPLLNPMGLTLSRMVVLPHPRLPQTLAWEPAEPPPPAVATFARSLQDALAPAEVRPQNDRPFRPHVTVARFRRAAGRRIENRPMPAPVPSGEFPLETLCLYESTLAPEGARYEVLARWLSH